MSKTWTLAGLLALASLSIIIAAVTLGGAGVRPAAATPPPPDGPLDLPLLVETCTQCHNLQRIDVKRLDREAWTMIVERMQEYIQFEGGAFGELTDEEVVTIVDFLVQRRGPDRPVDPDAPVIPDVVTARCTTCHDVDRILSVRKTPEAWASTVERMRWYVTRRIRERGADAGVEPMPARDVKRIKDWLSSERPLLAEEIRAARAAAEPPDVVNLCTTCHDMDTIRSTVRTPDAWDATVHRMEDFRSGWSNIWGNRFSSLRDEDEDRLVDAAITFLSENRNSDTEAWRRFQEQRAAGIDRLEGSWTVFGTDRRGSYRGTISFEGRGNASYNAHRVVAYEDGSKEDWFGVAQLFGDSIRETFTVRQQEGAADILGSAFDDDAPAGEDEDRVTILGSLDLDETGTLAEGTLGPQGGGGDAREVMVRGAGADVDGEDRDAFDPPGDAVRTPRIVRIEPSVLFAGDTLSVQIQGVFLPAPGEIAKIDLGPGITVSVQTRGASPVSLTVKLEVAEDAELGRRTARIEREGWASITGGEAAVIAGMDHVRVEPPLGLARVGGAPLVPERQGAKDDDRPIEKKLERFRAIAWSNGPDGEPYTDDDVRIGPAEGAKWSSQAVDITRGRDWSAESGASHESFRIDASNGTAVMLPGLGTFYWVANEPKQATIGSIDPATGLFTPGGDEPMLELDGEWPEEGTEKNNTGDNRGTVLIVVQVQGEDGPLQGEAVCVVAPPDYVPMLPFAGPSRDAAPWKGLEADARHAEMGEEEDDFDEDD